MRAPQGQAHTAHAEEGILLFRHRPVGQGLVAAHIQGAGHQRAAVERIEHAAVLGLLGGQVRRLRVGHEDELGAQQAHALGALGHGLGGSGAVAEVGADFQAMAIAGDGRFQLVGIGQLQAALAAFLFLAGTLQLGAVGRHDQTATLAVQQKLGAWVQQQYGGAGAHQGGNPQGTGDDGAVGGGAATGGEDAGHAVAVQPRHIRGRHLVHQQDVGLFRLGRVFHAAELAEHTAAYVAQVGGPLGEQRVVQALLLGGGGFDHGHPGGGRAFALLEAGVHFVAQLGVGEHFQVGDEDFADGLGLAAQHQRLDVAAHMGQGLLQAFTLDAGGLAAQRIVHLLVQMDMRGPHGNAGRGGNCLELAARCGRGQRLRLRLGVRHRRFPLRQRLYFLAQPLLDGGLQGWQRRLGDGRLGEDFQYLATAHAEAEQLAQALGGNRGGATVGHPHADLALEGLGQLHQLLGRSGVQAVGVGQRQAQAGPVGLGFAAQGFENGAALGGAGQFAATALDQQRAQAFQQGQVGIPQAGQAEQAVEWLVEVAQGLFRGQVGQARALHGLVAVQPPETVAKRQRLTLQ
ncbi:hypothetical protein D3C85_443770 [compost metagenome]